jgi:hypothetical protein
LRDLTGTTGAPVLLAGINLEPRKSTSTWM